MECPKCHHQNPTGAKFCMECGAKLENVCPECGAKLPPGAKFCMECGAKVSAVKGSEKLIAVPKLEDVHANLQRSMPRALAEKMQSVASTLEGENRILSILFGDISGSVPLAEKMSPEDAADLINECLKVMVDAILKYEGSINRYIGDCVLAFFGAPTAHENDPERAILAALEMRDAVTKLNLNIKIGINTGMVYVGAMGPDAHREFAAMGSAVNLASRLQGATQRPGQILVGESTYRLTRRSFEFQPMPPLTLKGIDKPVSAYEVLKVLPKPEKIRGIEGLRAEMIGREKEFTVLKECADELFSGRGQIVSIIGEAGVGKSRLVSELKAEIERKKPDTKYETRNTQYAILEGRCVSIGESIGYWVFIDILRSYLSFSPEDSPKELGEKIVASMQALFPQRWEEIVPYIGNLLSVRFGNQWDEKVKYMPPEQVKYQTFLTLRDLFLAMAQQKPLLLILEDLHWADNLSLDLLTLLMDALTLAPLMLLCVYRPEKEHKSWHISAQASAKCLDRYTEITLRALNPQESRRLVESLLYIENLPESVKESILGKAEGNPFFVEEVIRSLIERGIVYQVERSEIPTKVGNGSRWVAKEEVKEIAVPDTIQSVIMARVDRLEDEVKYVLQSAAVIGRLFRHKLLEYTTQQERNLDRYLWQLEERDLVYEERAIPELEYSFKHALTQETAYNTILSRRRKEFHRKVAEGYEALYSDRVEEYYEELAYHYSRSDDNQKALHYLVKAGDKSKEAFANEEAIAYYNQALKVMDGIEGVEPTLRGHIYQSLGEIYFPLTKHEEALECCRKALEYITDKKQRARIYGTIGWIYEQVSEYDLALSHLNAGIAELGDDSESPEMARICIPLAWVKFRNTQEAIEIAQRGMKIAERESLYFEMVELYTCLNVQYGYGLGNIDKAFEYVRRAVEVARRSANSYLIGQATFWLGWVYLQTGLRRLREDGYDAALKLFEEAVGIFEKIGHNFALGQVYYHIWFIYRQRGDWDKEIEWLERGLTIPSHPSYSFFVFQLAGVYSQRGDAERAIEMCKRFLEDSDSLTRAKDIFSVNGMSINTIITQSLGIMEYSLAQLGRREEFIPYCRKLREEIGKAFPDLKLTQWYLEPKELSGLFTQTAFADEFDGTVLKSEWEWINPKGDSNYNLSSEVSPAQRDPENRDWLEMHAASGYYFLDAPRLLQEISGDFDTPTAGFDTQATQPKPQSKDFAIEARMKAASDDLPSVSGLLVWKDKENFIRFERGMHGKDEFGLSGAVGGKFEYLGRGMLTSEVVYLRLERIGDKISAYCSGDGANPAEQDAENRDWLTCGEVSLPTEDPVQVGIHAIGPVDIPGREGATATRFDYFKIFRTPE